MVQYVCSLFYDFRANRRVGWACCTFVDKRWLGVKRLQGLKDVTYYAKLVFRSSYEQRFPSSSLDRRRLGQCIHTARSQRVPSSSLVYFPALLVDSMALVGTSAPRTIEEHFAAK